MIESGVLVSMCRFECVIRVAAAACEICECLEYITENCISAFFFKVEDDVKGFETLPLLITLQPLSSP